MTQLATPEADSEPNTEVYYDSIWSHLMQVDFRQAWVTAGGINTRYVQAGSPTAPTLLLLHGIGGSWECFCANIGAYSKHFNVLALDLVGAGFSDKPEQPVYEIHDYIRHVTAFLEVMKVDQVSIFGVSMGGWIAARFAHTYPKRVKHLILCAVSGLTRPPAANLPAINSLRNDRMAAIDDPTWERVKNVFTDLIHDEKKRLPDFIKVRQTVYQLPEMKASMRRILALTENDMFAKSAIADDEWRSIQTPTLLVGSNDDSEHFKRNISRAAGLLPHATRVDLNGVAHWPQFEDWQGFNALSLKFLLSAS
jgi:2-hydroxy-6-oxonona-2,4-dienedioate hydrolase